ncbi:MULTISPECIES: hypothetical protein [unclassified Archaeoglobus]|jgi:hypothetical protein|uniref:hypothetical protein n=1 Tax=unclassified Archaeoglobus TaxID=2643606 RepID=UPI0025BB1488|nr:MULTISPECIES: hypothetical protein [unclassified Archaeoglobus]
MSEQMLKRYIAELVGSLTNLGDGISDYLQKLNHLSCIVSAALKKYHKEDGKLPKLRSELNAAMIMVYSPKGLSQAWVTASKIEEELVNIIFEKDLVDYTALLDFQQKLNEKWKRRGGSHES